MPTIPESLAFLTTSVDEPGAWAARGYGYGKLKESFPFQYTTPHRPALAWFKGALQCVYRAGYGDNRLLVITCTPDSDVSVYTWSTETEFYGQTTWNSPAVAVFKDTLYCVYVSSSGDNKLYYTSSSDGFKWSSAKSFPNHFSNFGPGLAVFNDTLFCVYPGAASDNYALNSLIYTTFTGTPDVNGDYWSAATAFPNHFSYGDVSLVATSNTLRCAHRGDQNDDRLLYTDWDGTKWSDDKSVSTGTFISAELRSSAGPALTFNTDSSSNTWWRLVFKEKDSTQLRWTQVLEDDDQWHASSKLTALGSKSQTGPALLTFPVNDTSRMICMYRYPNI